MNKFKKLADKLLKIKLWKSEITLVQLIQGKDERGHVIFVDDLSKKINCVKNEYTKKLENDKFDTITEFFISTKDLEDYDMKCKFQINYNGRKYFVEEVVGLGTMNNEDALVKFIVRR